MKRKLLHILSWVILVAGLIGAYFSYRYHEGINAGNEAVDLLKEGKLEEAIAKADRAIDLRPDDGLGYYVRGAAKFRLIAEQNAQGSLIDCKKDLERALALTQHDSVRKFCNDILMMIEVMQSSS